MSKINCLFFNRVIYLIIMFLYILKQINIKAIIMSLFSREKHVWIIFRTERRLNNDGKTDKT